MSLSAQDVVPSGSSGPLVVPPSSTSTPIVTTSNNDGFTPAGSPPLILAFLALGVLSAAMLVVFGWRKFRFGRAWRSHNLRLQRELQERWGMELDGWPADGVEGSGGEYYRRGLMAMWRKPKLWDLWTDVGDTQKGLAGLGGEKSDLCRWMNILPLSAKAVLLDNDEPIERGWREVNPLPPPPSSGLLHRAMNVLRRPLHVRLPWLQRDEAPIPNTDRGKPFDPTSSSISQPFEGIDPPRIAIQVEVLIAMPSVGRSVYYGRKQPDNYEGMLVDYAIGVHECPWEYDDF